MPDGKVHGLRTPGSETGTRFTGIATYPFVCVNLPLITLVIGDSRC
jgi:hypothetical protein